MNESKKTRVMKLEQSQTVQGKKYCSCRCHDKSILDFNILSDEKIIAFAEIMERMIPTYAEDLEKRRAARPKCTCLCKH